MTDTTPPTIPACGTSVTIVAGSGGQAAVPNLTGGVTDYSTPVTVTQSPAAGTLVGVPGTSVALKATDAAGNVAQCTASVIVQVQTRPPTITVKVNPELLWPPNHKLVTITATVTASDPSGRAPVIRLVSITSSEPDNGLGDGDTANDIQGAAFGTDDRVFQLRAERKEHGPGRIYYITYSATGPSGIVATASAQVIVPDNMGHGGEVDDDCHGQGGHGHHDGDGCFDGHHGHFDGDNCQGRDGYHHHGDGHHDDNDRHRDRDNHHGHTTMG